MTWRFGNGQTVTQAWNAQITANGADVTARNVSYNGALGGGASTQFGFLGSGQAAVPALGCTAS